MVTCYYCEGELYPVYQYHNRGLGEPLYYMCKECKRVQLVTQKEEEKKNGE